MTRTRIAIGIAGFALAFSTGLPARAQLGDVLNQGSRSSGGALGGISGGQGSMGGMGGMGALGGQSLTSGSMGNAAGVLSFCIKNNYLGGGSASGIRDSLVGRLGGRSAAASNPGYLDGSRGVLHSSGGQQIGLGGAGVGGVKAEITRKVCDQVLKQAGSML